MYSVVLHIYGVCVCMKNKIVRKIVLAIIVILVLYIGYGIYKENKIRSVEKVGDITQLNKVANATPIAEIEEDDETEVEAEKEKVTVPTEYLGFDVAAELVIPKLDLRTNVLKKYSESAMDVCPTKFWGPEPNEIGNFCIVGHNYQKGNMFYNLAKLEVGDKICLLDNINGEVMYEIYDIYKVRPENTNPIGQETDGKKIVTLITCVNYSDKRLIVQAVEI